MPCHVSATPWNGSAKVQAEGLRRKEWIGDFTTYSAGGRGASAAGPEIQHEAGPRRRAQGRGAGDAGGIPTRTMRPHRALGCAALRRGMDRWRSRDAPKSRQRARCNRGECREGRRTAHGWRRSREELAAEGNLPIGERGEGKADAPQAMRPVRRPAFTADSQHGKQARQAHKPIP